VGHEAKDECITVIVARIELSRSEFDKAADLAVHQFEESTESTRQIGRVVVGPHPVGWLVRIHLTD